MRRPQLHNKSCPCLASQPLRCCMLFFALFRITHSRSHFISKLNWSVDLRVDMSAVTPDSSLDDVSSWLSTDLEAFLRNDRAEPEPSSSKNADASAHEAHQQTDKKKKKKQTRRQKSTNIQQRQPSLQKSERRLLLSRHLHRLHPTRLSSMSQSHPHPDHHPFS